MCKIKYNEILDSVFIQYKLMLLLLLLLLLLLPLMMMMKMMMMMMIIIIIYKVHKFLLQIKLNICLFSFLQQLKMGDSKSNCEASGESSKLLEKKEESLALGSLHSGGNSRQYPDSGPSKSTQIVPLQEERIEIGFDFMGFTRFQWYSPGIFEVVARGDDKALYNLLTNYKPEAHSIDSKGNTALHHAVASACRKGDSDDSLYQCIDLLMSCEEMKVNMPNKNGYTAIGLAVHNLHKKCIQHMLKHPSVDRLYLDYYPGDRESTVREIIVETYPELQPLLKECIKEYLDLSEGNMKLLAALQHGEYYTFKDNLDSNNPNPW